MTTFYKKQIKIHLKKIITFFNKIANKFISVKPNWFFLILNSFLFLSLLLIFINQITILHSDLKYTFPKEYRDGAIIDIANEFKQNNNPFSTERILPHNYTYGFIPPLIVGTIAKFIDVSIVKIQLFLSLILILLMLIIVGIESWRNTKDFLFTTSSLIIILIFLNISFRPEIYAIFLSILVLIMLNHEKQNYFNIFIFSIISILLYYIKPYFIILFAAMFFYYLSSNNKKNNLFILVISATIFTVVSYFFINHVYPMYFSQTFVNNFNMYNTHKFIWMVNQFLDFFLNNWAICLFFLILSIYSIVLKKSDFLKNVYFIYILISIICLFSLGQHTGTYLTYYNQLLPIPIILFIGNCFKENKSHSLKFVKYLFIFSIIINYRYLLVKQANTHNYNLENWQEAINYIKKNNPEKSYLSPNFTSIAIENSWPIYDNGQTEVFFAGDIFEGNPKFFKTLFPNAKMVSPMFRNWTRNLNSMVAEKQFSLIALPKEHHSLINNENLTNNYFVDKTISLPTNLGDIEFWKPI